MPVSSGDQTPHEYVDAELSVPDLKTASDEQTVSSALSGREGIVSLRISQGHVAVEYDPIQITKAEIGKLINEAGFRITEVETGMASPISDAWLHESDENP